MQRASRAAKASRRRNARREPGRESPGFLAMAVCGAGRLVLRLGLLALLLALLAGVSLGLLAGYRWMTSSPFFAVDSISVSGAARLTEAEVARRAGVERGDNLFALSIDRVEERLSAHPWVERAAVVRELPSGLALHVTERTPCMWVRRGGELYYADAQGVVIDKVGPDRFASLPLFEMEVGAEDWLDQLPAFMEALRQGRWGFGPEGVSWMRVAPGRMELALRSGVRLRLDPIAWSEGLDSLSRVMADLKARGEWASAERLTASGEKVWVGFSGGDTSRHG